MVGLASVLALAPARVAAAGVTAPTGRMLTPAGTSVEAGSFPGDALYAPPSSTRPNGSVFVADAGENPDTLLTYDPAALAVTQTLGLSSGTGNVPDAQSGHLALSPDGATLYASGGQSGTLHELTATAAPVEINRFVLGQYISGIAPSRDGVHVYVAEPLEQCDPHADNAKGCHVVDVNTSDGSSTTLTVGSMPDAVATATVPGRTHEVLAVAERDAASVRIIDAATNATLTEIATGRHPVALRFVAGGTHLLVLDSLDDDLVDIRTSDWAIVDRLALGGPDGLGAGPSALTASSDGGSVYVAASADNAVVVIHQDSGGGHVVSGRIPTGEYATAVQLDAGAANLFITAGKGVYGSGTTTDGGGTLARVTVPDAATLASYAAQVSADNRWNQLVCNGSPAPAIQHVVYVIRENKTFDEDLGDVAGGNPLDLANVMYPQVYTPNLHALAQRYAVLRGFYADEEVSDTGHQFLMGGVANDWVERLTHQSYAIHFAPRQGAELGDHNDILNSPSNYLLDLALQSGISFRDYGEFYRTNQAGSGVAVTAALESHIARDYPGFGFDTNTADTARITTGIPTDPTKVPWLTHFTADVANGTFPQLEVVYLPEDHTGGNASGGTPGAQVAGSDLATGQLISAISHSPYWGSTAILLTEDDPQSGTDSVDPHRTVGLVVSPWAKENVQSVTHYDNDSMLQMVERLVGLRPLTEFDATAAPMDDLFIAPAATPDLRPYDAVTPSPPPGTTATKAAYRQLVGQLLGPSPDWSNVSPIVQHRLQVLSLTGHDPGAAAGATAPGQVAAGQSNAPREAVSPAPESTSMTPAKRATAACAPAASVPETSLTPVFPLAALGVVLATVVRRRFRSAAAPRIR